jgi:hypothetical protein
MAIAEALGVTDAVERWSLFHGSGGETKTVPARLSLLASPRSCDFQQSGDVVGIDRQLKADSFYPKAVPST